MMIKEYLNLMRWKDWIKNIFFLLPIVFYPNLITENVLLMFLIGFFSISLISSVNYILNDILDRKSDAKHSVKKKRPIASGKVSVRQGIIFAVLLFIISIALGVFTNIYFLVCIAGLFILGQTYSFLTKKYRRGFVTIPLNYILRVFAGVLIIRPFFIMSDIASVLFIYFLISFIIIEKKKIQKKIEPKLADRVSGISIILAVLSFVVMAMMAGKPLLAISAIPLALICYISKQLFEKDVDNIMKPHIIFTDILFSLLFALLVLAVLLSVVYG